MANNNIVYSLGVNSNDFTTSLDTSWGQFEGFKYKMEETSKGVQKALEDIITPIGNMQKSLEDITTPINGVQKCLEDMLTPVDLLDKALGSILDPTNLLGTALDVLSTAINSTKSSSQEFGTVMGQTRTSINTFFSSLTRGSLKTFMDNLKHAVKQSRLLSETMNKLQSSTLWNRYDIAVLESQKSVLLETAEDETKSQKERLDALEKAKKLEEEISTIKSKQSEEMKNAAVQSFNTALSEHGFNETFSFDDINTFREALNTEAGIYEDFEKYKKAKNILDNKSKTVKTTNMISGGSITGGYQQMQRKAFTSEEISQAERDVKALEAKLPAVYIQALLALDDTHDGEGSALENFVSLMEESVNIRPNTSEMSNYYSVVSDGIRSVSTAASKTKTVVEKANAVTEEMGPKIDVNSTTYITYLTNCYNNILLMRDACEEGTDEWEQQNKKLTELNEQLEEAQRRVMEYKRCIELANQEPLTLPSLGKEAAAKPTTFDFSTINNGNEEVPKDPFAAAMTSANAYSRSLTNVSNSMRSIASATNESTAAWLNYGAGIATAIASAIPQIMALTIARKAEAAAGKEAAIAEGAASVASIPLVGWTMAIAAIAGIVAAFAAIPSFATGGIMGGNSFSGDKLLARINSGEMILNKAQQSNLFNMIGTGINYSGSPQMVVLSTRLRGKDIEISGKNYRQVQNKLG